MMEKYRAHIVIRDELTGSPKDTYHELECKSKAEATRVAKDLAFRMRGRLAQAVKLIDPDEPEVWTVTRIGVDEVYGGS